MSFYGKTYKRGQIIEGVTNNESHGLIEKGLAKLFVPVVRKIMTAGKKKGYKTKWH